MNPIVKLVVDVLATGALGVAVWALYRELEKWWPKLPTLDTFKQRAVVAALCPLVVAPVFGLAVLMRWLPQPADWRQWLTLIGDYALAAFLWSQGSDGLQRARAEAKAKPE